MKKFPAAPLSADSVRFARNHDTAGWKGKMGEEGRDGGSRGVLAGHPYHLHLSLSLSINIYIYTSLSLYT